MKSVSRFALAIAAAALTVGATSTGWAAEEKPKKEKGKKEKAPEPIKLSLSPSFQKAYNTVVGPYAKKRDAASAAVAKAAWPSVTAAIANEDDRYQAGILGQDIAVLLNDRPLQQEALELLIASTRTPPEEKRVAHYFRGENAYNAKDWPNSIMHMQKAYEMGFRANTVEGGVELLIAEALAQQGKLPEALDWLTKSDEGSKVAGAKPLPANFNAKALRYAIGTKDYRYIGPWMKTLIRKNPTADYWHDGLMQTYTLADLDSQEVLDLMRLLRAVGGMKYQQNYSAYATDDIAAFFPVEVKTLLEEGFAAGTISDKNVTFGGLHKAMVEKLELDPFSLKVLDQDIANAKTGFEAASSGDIALSVGEYARAKTAYEAALAKGSIVDNKDRKDLTERTVMRLGMAKLKLGDLAGAKQEFAKVASPGRKEVADFWSVYADQLAKTAAPAA